MNKNLKYALLVTAAIVGIVAAGVGYVALTFNPNDYKAQIIRAVKDNTQRNLHLDGEIKLSFYPNIGASLGKISLSEFNDNRDFASISSARVSLALMPLLRRQLVVNEVAVSGLKANLVKHKDGTSNIEDLIGSGASHQPEQKAAASQPVTFNVDSISVENAELSYRDESSGAQYSIKGLNLKTGRIAIGVPCEIDLSAGVQANQPKLDLVTQLKTVITFDLDNQRYQASGLNFQVSGSALDFDKLKVTGSGDLSADLGSQKFSGKKLELNANMDAPFGNIVASLALPAVGVNAQTIEADAIVLALDVKQPAQAFKVKFSTPLSGNIKTQLFDLSNFVVAMNATGDKLPNKSVSSEMKGSLQLDVQKQSASLKLAGGMLQSQVKASLGVTDFSNPAIKFDVDLDRLDADLYLPKSSSAAAEPDAKQPELPFDLSALRKLNLTGSLRIGDLKVMNVKTSKLRIDVKGQGGVVKVDPFSANLYAGSISSNILLNAAKALPEFAVNAKLSGISIGPLLNDAMQMDFLSGKGSVELKLATQGNLVRQLKKNLSGTMSLNLADGAVKGINLAKKAREFGKGGDKTQAANREEKTDFSELKANFKITGGVAHNEDLSLQSPFIRIGGKGDIDLGNDRLDYLVKATITGTMEGQGGKEDVRGLTVPVRLSGPFTELTYKLDFGAMVSDAARQKASAAADAAKQKAQQAVDAQKEQAKAKVQEELKKGLKGLFK